MKSNVKKQQELKQLLFYIAIIILPIIQVSIFYVYVNGKMMVMAFQEYDYGLTGEREAGYYFLGLDNFKLFFDSFKQGGDIYVLPYALKNSFIYSIICFVISTPLVLLFSFYFYKKGMFASGFKAILFMPQIVSSLILCVIFKYVAEDVLPQILRLLNPNASVAGFLSTTDIAKRTITIISFNIFFSFGSNILIYIGAMNGVDPSTEEAVLIDGANDWQLFFYIVMPKVYPTLVTFITVTFSGMFTNQFSLFSLYSINSVPYESYTMGYYLYRRVFLAGTSFAELPQLSAIGLIITIVIAPISVLVNKLLTKVGPSED